MEEEPIDKYGYTVKQNLAYSLFLYLIVGLIASSVMYFVFDTSFKEALLTMILFYSFMTWFSIIKFVYLTNYE